MSAPYVCPSCRHNVLRHGVNLRRLPRTSRATFISFASNHGRNTSEKENAEPSPNANDRSSPSDHAPQPEKKSFDSPSSQPPLSTRLSSPSRADTLSSLFNVLDIPHARDARGKYSGTPIAEQTPHQSRALPYRNRPMTAKPQHKPIASTLDAILSDRKDTAIVEAWKHFQTHFTSPDCEALQSPSLLDVRYMVENTIFRKLLRALINEWCVGKFDDSLPDPIQAVEKFNYLNLMSVEMWQDALWTLNMNAFKKVNGAAVVESGRSLAEIMSQLMKAWDKFFKQYATSTSHPLVSRPSDEVEPPATMWSSLPSPAATREISRRRKYLRDRFHDILRDISPHRINRITYSAHVTFDILARDGIQSALDQKILTEFRPFTVFLAHLIFGAKTFYISQDPAPGPSNDMQSQLEISRISQEDIAALFDRIKRSRGRTRGIIGAYESWGGSDGKPRSPRESLKAFYLGAVARAYQQGKPLTVYQLWLEASEAMSRHNEDGMVAELPAELYNLILEALVALRNLDQAIQVWNKMIENGTYPTVATWTSMLNGCGKARDIHGLEQMWVRMLNAGVQPDVYAWSSRISGIMGVGKIEHGLRVLEEMGKIWVEAYKRMHSGGKKGVQVDDASLPARPSTVILNGAITALSKMPPRHHRYVARVLAWGRSFGIEPDHITFNALISMSLKNDNVPEAVKLLQQMEKSNVKPDIATFTIILNSIFRSSSAAAMSQEEQNDKVTAILQNLDARGFEANAHVYSSLIDGLLKSHGNEQAGKAVLRHMTAKKIEVPPHVYTILMTYYFQREDFDAVEALWTQIQASGTVVDMVFYDRMIERYAAVHDTGKMTTFLTHMSKQGLTPGWPALQAVVVKLADIGDWERFDEIVNDVQTGSGIARRGLRKSDENVIDRFWSAVEYKKKQRPRPEGEQAGPFQAP